MFITLIYKLNEKEREKSKVLIIKLLLQKKREYILLSLLVQKKIDNIS